MKKFLAVIGAIAAVNGMYAGESLLGRIPSTDPVKHITLTPADHRQWQKLSFNSRNLLYSSKSITLNSQAVGPILRYNLSGTNPQFIVIDLVYSGTDDSCPGPQQQTLITLNAPDGKGILWGFRFGKDHVRFLDEKPVTVFRDADGRVPVKIIVDAIGQTAEVYSKDSKVPVLSKKAFKLKAPASVTSVSIGDGSSAIKGICELYLMDVKLY